MIRLVSKKRGIVLAAALCIMIIPGVAYAHDGEVEDVRGDEASHVETIDDDKNVVEAEDDSAGRTSAEARVQRIKEEVNGRVTAAKTRLADAKLKRCQARQKAVTNIMARIGDRGQKQLDLFTTIADRVEDFYAEKGYTLESYDSLVADVQAKKEAAQTVVSDIKTAETTFECDGEDPHGVVDGFKASLRQEITVLKEYKTAVKNLIVGVKSAHTADATATDEGAQE